MAPSNRLPAFLPRLLKHFTEGCAAYGLAMYPCCTDPRALADMLPAKDGFAGTDPGEPLHRAAERDAP